MFGLAGAGAAREARRRTSLSDNGFTIDADGRFEEIEVLMDTGASGARASATGGGFGFDALVGAGGRLLLEMDVLTTTRRGALDVLVVPLVEGLVVCREAFCKLEFIVEGIGAAPRVR